MSRFRKILNLEGHLNCFIGSKVTAILVNRGILPSGGIASGRVCACLHFLGEVFLPLIEVEVKI